MAAPASPSLADAALPELAEPPQKKKGVQLAGFAAGIASVSIFTRRIYFLLTLLLLGMDKGEHRSSSYSGTLY
jgi:hypothetical protein